jgi:transposase-like protein
LSEARSEEDLLSLGAAHNVSYGVTNYAANEKAGEVKVEGNSNDASFDCPHCDKTYTAQRGLTVSYAHYLLSKSRADQVKRHLADKRSVCAQNREVRTAPDGNPKWACPRCHVQMVKKNSVEVSVRDLQLRVALTLRTAPHPRNVLEDMRRVLRGTPFFLRR